MSNSSYDVNLIDATVQITGSDIAGRYFGSGFVVHHDGAAAYVLTCAHVMADIGGADEVYVDALPAEVFAIGDPTARDLALLRVPGLTAPILPLLPPTENSQPDQTLRIVGFQIFGSGQRLLQPITAYLAETTRLGIGRREERVRAWRLRVEGERSIEPGFSGAAVFDLTSGYVVGIVSHRQGTTGGLAIAASEVERLWPRRPAELPDLFTLPALRPIDASLISPPAAVLHTAKAIERAVRDLLPAELYPQLDYLSDRLLYAVAQALAGSRSTSYVPIPAEYSAVLHALAGQTVDAGENTISFGRDNQYGDIRINDVVGGHQIKVYINDQDSPRPSSSPPPLARPLTVSILAGASGDTVATALRAQLALRGLVARPAGEDDDQPALDTLTSSAAALLTLSPDRLDDDDLTEEVQQLRLRRERDSAFTLYAQLEGISEKTLGRAGIDLKSLGAVTIKNPIEAPALARRILKRAIEQYQPQLLTDQTLDVGLFSFPPNGPGAIAPIRLDWREHYRNETYPTPAVWRSQLFPALNDLYDVLMGHAQVIRLHVSARLGSAFAFGHQFRSVSLIRLLIPQRDGEWQTRDYDPWLQPLERTEIDLDPDGSDITIELPITQGRVAGDVKGWIDANTPLLRRRVLLSPRGGAGVSFDANMAHAIACQVRSTILNQRKDPRLTNGTIHLFGAIPAALGALIGWHLNACEPVQCYELEGNTVLRPSCLLQR